MDGTIFGNIMGISYYLFFQLIGISFVFLMWRRERPLVRILLGSVVGTVSMMWFPVLCSFFVGFTLLSHILGIILAAFVFGAGTVFYRRRDKKEGQTRYALFDSGGFSWNEALYALVVLPLFLFYLYLLYTHTIPYAADGSIHTGQATYGDMNMHLAFITSIAKQKTFPPDYSMLPGTRLSYPFFGDSVSSSIYLFGSSLRIAYIFPMAVAFLQVLLSTLILGQAFIKNRKMTLLAWCFFFFNGGFGFLYFIPGLMKKSYTLKELFEGFYIMPTNLYDQNIRWANVVNDILLPQRASIFGWSVLIPVLYIIYRAMKESRRSYFVAGGILAGGMPLIHTHSFLALGMICAMWLLYSLNIQNNPKQSEKGTTLGQYVMLVFFLLMCVLNVWDRFQNIPDQVYFGIGIGIIAAVGVVCVAYSVHGFRQYGKESAATGWGIFLGIVLLLALPQLVFWTFSQVQGGDFIRGHFNWGNEGDSYLLFYLKNMGIVWIVGVIAIFFTKSREYFMSAPVFFIWSIAELIVFQPNEYDNNKLLYIAYLFLCYLAAFHVLKFFEWIGKKWITVCGMTVLLVLSSISAVLSLGREAVSDYQLYEADEVRMCKYIEKHTDPTDVILTNTSHNNGVVSLTGRNIVCGAGSFLYYHGLDYDQAEQDVQIMYENPEETALFDQYQVKYVYISNKERADYSVSEDLFEEGFDRVHREGDVVLYRRR